MIVKSKAPQRRGEAEKGNEAWRQAASASPGMAPIRWHGGSIHVYGCPFVILRPLLFVREGGEGLAK
ncbi:MAG: hypothetical protein ACI8T1_002687 [Verrucomicrobiales bacterium]|jgi:hypothetical protein